MYSNIVHQDLVDKEDILHSYLECVDGSCPSMTQFGCPQMFKINLHYLFAIVEAEIGNLPIPIVYSFNNIFDEEYLSVA